MKINTVANTISTFYPYYKKNIRLAYPIVISQAGQMLVGIADNMMVGHVNSTSLAAASFSNSVFVNFLVIALGFSFALTPLVGRALGAGRFHKIVDLFKHGLVINTLLGIVLCILLYGLSSLMPFMGQEAQIIVLAVPYTEILALSMIPIMLFFTLKQFAEGVAVIKPTMFITLIANLLNVFLNYVLIFGHFGFAAMGLLGAGYATLIARIAMALLLGIYIFTNHRFSKFVKFSWVSPLKKIYFYKIISLGIPSTFQILMEVMAFSLTTVMMGWLGASALASHQIALNIAALLYMIANGLAASSTIRVSNLLGQNNRLEIRKYVYSYYHLVIAFMVFSGILIILLHEEIPYWYVKDDQVVIQLAGNLLIMGTFFLIFDGLQTVCIASLRGLGDVNIPAYIAAFSYWFMAIGLAYVLSFHTSLGPYGIWLGYSAGLATAAILLMWRFEVKMKIQSVEISGFVKPQKALLNL